MTSDTVPHLTGERIFRAAIIDPEGLWTRPLSILPSCGGRVQWLIFPTEPSTGHVDFCLRLTGKLCGHNSAAHKHVGHITVLVDASVAIGHRGCGAVLPCTHAMMHDVATAAAGAIFTVATANHLVSCPWDELLNVVSRDTLMVAAKVDRADHDSIAACALQNFAYFQGTSRIEPETTVLGIAVPRAPTLRLSNMGKVTRSLRALAGHRCHQLTGYRLISEADEAAFLLAAFPIPAFPGGPVRALRRWPR